MKNKNSYREFRGILDYLKSGESTIRSNEKDLVFALEDIVQMDRSNTMIKDLLSKDNKFETLLYIIEGDIRNADMVINNKCVNNIQKYIDRKEMLVKLKADILVFLNGQDIDYKDTKLDLIEKCLPSLNLDHFNQQAFFGKSMINADFSLNKDIITKVYNILADEKLMEELVIGIEKLDEEEKYNRIIKACSEAKRYKSKVYDNASLIIEYNATSVALSDLRQYIKRESDKDYDIKYYAVTEEINYILSNKFRSYFNKKKLKELTNQQSVLHELINKYEFNKNLYEKTKEKIKLLEEKLKEVGLLDFVNRKKDSLGKSLRHNLSRRIGYFYNKKSIDEYYDYIDTEFKASREKIGEVIKSNSDYLEKISSKARKLLTNNIDTCRIISEFANYSLDDSKVCPAVTLFILYGLVTIEDSSYDEKDFSVEEINSINLYYKDVIEKNYKSFLSEYIDIKSKTGRNYKKKVKE